MVSIDFTFFIQVINFLLMIFVLNLLLYKPILKILGKRQDQISASEEEVKDLNLTIEKRMAEYEAKIQKAKLEAMEQRNGILKEGADTGKKIMDEARADIVGMMEQFQEKLKSEMDQARNVLHNSSRRISMEIAEKVLGRSVQ
jgi:F-type H+-transporting ATPase subunit b